MKKSARNRAFQQMTAKKKQKTNQKLMDIGKQPVNRIELASVQNSLMARIDLALMECAAISEIMVKKDLCTYEEIKDGKQRMFNTLKLIRSTLIKADKELGEKASQEDISAYVHEVVAATGVDKELLTQMFGIAPTKSRILKPSQHKMIVTK